tara:strand:- start:249 stop:455 length:207 start_codon:yes stop_codon:yes gene_type:complete
MKDAPISSTDIDKLRRTVESNHRAVETLLALLQGQADINLELQTRVLELQTRVADLAQEQVTKPNNPR